MAIGQIGHHLAHVVSRVAVEPSTGSGLAQTQCQTTVEENVKDQQ